MFEKEAEEYLEKEQDKGYYWVVNGAGISQYELDNNIESAFQDGAEFGYSKANEWHYVKDGDLPKEKGAVLIYWKSGDIKCVSVVESSKVTENTHIIAWKEIMLPEVKE